MNIRAQLLTTVVTLVAALMAIVSSAVAQTVIWNGSMDMTWTEPDSNSWGEETYQSGFSCLFTNVGTGTVTIQGAGVNPGSVLVDTTSNYTFTGGAIGGTGPFTIGGSNVVTFANTNTYSGQTVVTGDGVLDVGNISHNAVSPSSGLYLGDTNVGDGIYGILEGNGTFTRSLSGNNAPGFNQISSAAGGFAAVGGPLTVNLGGSGAAISLNQQGYAFGNNFVFGSSKADNQVTVVNAINLNTTSGRTFTVNAGVGGDSVELQGVVSNGDSGNGNIFEKQGNGLLILAATNTYSGTTVVNNGTLLVNGSLASGSPVMVATNATLGGTGIIGGRVTVNGGGTIEAGAAATVGTLTTGSETWYTGDTLVFNLASATNSTRQSLLNINGTLTASSASKFIVKLTSVTASNTPGPLPDFNPYQNYTWTIATASSGLIGFSAASFTVNTNGFANSFAGIFSVTNIGNKVVAQYSTVVLVPPTIGNCIMQPDGSFQLTFSGPVGQTYRVLGTNVLTTPLATWPVLAKGTIGSSGSVIFIAPGTNKQWFYSIASP